MKKLAMLILVVCMSFPVFATEYSVITGYDSDSLEVYVNMLINKGWQCQGGVSETRDGSFVQAMIKE